MPYTISEKNLERQMLLAEVLNPITTPHLTKRIIKHVKGFHFGCCVKVCASSCFYSRELTYSIRCLIKELSPTIPIQ